jgi:hypothetical protein
MTGTFLVGHKEIKYEKSDSGLEMAVLFPGEACSIFNTHCCALACISACNADSISVLKSAVIYARTKLSVRAVYCIVKSDEKALERRLIKLGFVSITEFHRKRLYNDPAMLKMYFLSW